MRQWRSVVILMIGAGTGCPRVEVDTDSLSFSA